MELLCANKVSSCGKEEKPKNEKVFPERSGMCQSLSETKNPLLRRTWVTTHGLRGSWSLCSIPEDRNMAPTLFLVPRRRRTKRYEDDEDSAYEEDEPIYHRSPVSLENGYRPSNTIYELRFVPNPIFKDDDDDRFCSSEDDSSQLEEDFASPLPAEPEVESRFLLKWFVFLIHVLLMVLVVTFCLASISISLLIACHQSRQSSISPVPSQSEDRNHNPSTTPFPSNGISSFEWPTGVTISTSTVSTTHVEKVDDDILASIGVGDQIVSSEKEDQNTQKETIIQLVPDQEVRAKEELIEREMLQEFEQKNSVESNREEDSTKPVTSFDDRYIVKAVPKVFGTVDKSSDEIVEKAVNVESEKVTEPSTKLENVEKSVIVEQPETTVTPVDAPSEIKENKTTEEVVGTPNKTADSDIPSFREWTQKALEEEQKKRDEERRKRDEEREKKKQQQQQQQSLKQSEVGNVSTPASNAGGRGTPSSQQATVPVRLKKNFASPDCGAKIVNANPESQGASNVLSGYRDEYMLNKCSDRAWFVVELCESIKALKIEIGNFELYSSVPHEIRVSLGNTFPARDKDWSTFGTFKAEDDRNLQFFSAEGDVFGKYVKVEILSHHGTEHYCPISQFKIYGISEIELIGSDDEEDKNDDDSHDDDDVVTTTTTTNNNNGTPVNSNNNNVLKFIKEKMGETIEKVVGVFKTKDLNADVDMSQALNKTSLVGTTFAYNIACPGCTEKRLDEVYFLLATNFGKMSQALSKTNNIRVALTRSSVCQNYGINVTRDEYVTSKYVGHNLVNFYTTLFGASRIVALCNVIAIEQGLVQRISRGNDVKVEKTSEESSKNDTNTQQQQQKVKKSNESAESSIQSSTETVAAVDIKSSPTSSFVETSSNSVDSVAKPQASSVTVETTLTPPKRDEKASSQKDVTNQKDSIVTDVKPPIVDKILEPISPTPVTDPSANKVAPSEMPIVKEPEMKDPPEVVLFPPSDSSHIHSDEDSNGGNGNKPFLAGQGGRESVWQKLSNRIKTLERNVSLSSGYLEELSVQYKKQIEDLQMSMRLASESLAQSTKTRERDQFAMKHLQNEVANLSAVVANLTLQMDSLRTWAVVAHIIVLVAEATFGGLFLIACYKRLKRQHSELIPATASLTNLAPSVSQQPIVVHVNGKLPPKTAFKTTSTPLKRGYSLEDLEMDEADEDDENEANVKVSGKFASRRMSLDNLIQNGGIKNRQKLNGLTSSDLPMTRKQRRRMQRRLSSASSKSEFVNRRTDGLFLSAVNGHYSSGDSDVTKRNEREWTPVLRAGSVDRTPPPALETVTTLPNGRTYVTSTVQPIFCFPLSKNNFVSTSNAFGVLNNSLHDDPTPIKERSLNYRSAVEQSGVSAKKLKFSPEVVDKVQPEFDIHHLAAPKHGGGQRSGALKRSKSTSPTRSKNQAAKQRDMFKQFNPETADWIKH